MGVFRVPARLRTDWGIRQSSVVNEYRYGVVEGHGFLQDGAAEGDAVAFGFAFGDGEDVEAVVGGGGCELEGEVGVGGRCVGHRGLRGGWGCQVSG